jgi:hypothetical protein
VGTVGHLAGLRGGVGGTFSREWLIYPTLLSQRERLPRTRTIHRKRTSRVCELAWETYMSCASSFYCMM